MAKTPTTPKTPSRTYGGASKPRTSFDDDDNEVFDDDNGDAERTADEEAQRTTEPAKEATPQAEAERRKKEGIGAPTSADIAAAEGPAQAQLLADTAALMVGAPPDPDSAETIEEFAKRDADASMRTATARAAKAAETVTGITAQDMQNAQNAEVNMLTTPKPPKEIIEQRNEGLSHMPQDAPRRMGAVALPKDRALSLEEMGKAKVYGPGGGAGTVV